MALDAVGERPATSSVPIFLQMMRLNENRSISFCDDLSFAIFRDWHLSLFITLLLLKYGACSAATVARTRNNLRKSVAKIMYGILVVLKVLWATDVSVGSSFLVVTTTSFPSTMLISNFLVSAFLKVSEQVCLP